MRIFIVAGSPRPEPPLGLRPGPDDLVMAADLGASHARAWGWPVHVLIGDLDSLAPGEAASLAASGTRVITAPPAKDETDLELAVTRALNLRRLDHNAALTVDQPEMIICAALGGRVDHMLANVLLLTRPDLAGRRVTIIQGGQAIQILRGSAGADPAHLRLLGETGDLLSLVPVGGDAIGVTTGNLRYPLRDETLFLGQGRGVSNVFDQAEAHVWLRQGMLLVVHTCLSVEPPPLSEHGGSDE